MSLHPLRKIYIDAIWEEYGVKIWGDKTPERTEAIANKVNALGMSYLIFVRLALMLWDDWSQKQGHAYPYWNMITCDATFETLGGYLRLIENMDVQAVDPEEFARELEYAMSYIDWLAGWQDLRPLRPRARASQQTKILVAEYICRLYGLPAISSNYNDIAFRLERDRNGR